ncbi:MAG: site-specific DNA-methyltransferase, partial [Synergistaceae bacterium]|nr:site-specific DNA-methyltransferase [Synergistaceae bacterium]
FATPKPEKLIQKVINAATNPCDLVLDSLLGSGKTAAVAHKMRRRYIGIEIGDHAYTHCKTRLDKVIAGEDQGGITKSAGWTSGGATDFTSWLQRS